MVDFRRAVVLVSFATYVKSQVVCGVLIELALCEVCRCNRLAIMLITTLLALNDDAYVAYRNVVPVLDQRKIRLIESNIQYFAPVLARLQHTLQTAGTV
jgi:hypothetical protein